MARRRNRSAARKSSRAHRAEASVTHKDKSPKRAPAAARTRTKIKKKRGGQQGKKSLANDTAAAFPQITSGNGIPRDRGAKRPRTAGRTRTEEKQKRSGVQGRKPPTKSGAARKAQKDSATRSYTARTLKELFALSGNQCAYPDCTNEIVVEGTQDSDAAVVGQICHIYAASDDGPRGKPGLTTEERNSAANLILMCGHHHPIVDKQWETHPAYLL